MPSFNGVLDASGVDGFTVSLVAGRRYFIEVAGLGINSAPPLDDPNVAIRVLGQPVLASDDDGGVGRNPRLVFVPTETRDYRIEVGGAADGGYALQVEADDFRGTVEGLGPAGRVTAGFGAGELDFEGDGDIHEVTLIKGLSYVLEARGLGSGGGSLADPLLELFDPGRRSVGLDTDSGPGTDARISFRAAQSGKHFLDVRAEENETGTYVVAVGAGRGRDVADRIVGTSQADAIDGRGGDDVIRGGRGHDRLLGGDGDDELRGERGSDLLFGGDGDDLLVGAEGGDTFRGGLGRDVLIGGKGADFFVLGGRSDSRPGAADILRAGNGAAAFDAAGGPAGNGDTFDFSAIDANRSLDGNQAFRLGGVGIGRLSLVNEGSSTIVRGNVDADAAFEIRLVIADGEVRAGAYNAGDFLL